MQRETPGAWLALLFLFLVATVNYVDRQILVILLQPIKEDLKLSDTQLGLLTGVAFALCFAIAGVPIARLADRTSPRLIIGASLAIWSLFTALCGFAQSFLQLMAARVLVAVGEAGSGPASQSMIAGMFPHGRRASAIAILTCSIPVGVLLGLALGGILNEAVGWRQAFLLVGLPGVIVALLFVLIVKEPGRADQSASSVRPSLIEAFRRMWSIRSYRLLAMAAAVHLFSAAAFNQWIASYLIRTFSLETAEVGLSLGLIVGLAGAAGTLAGGYGADRLGRVNPLWFARLPAIMAFFAAPMTIAIYFAPSFEFALVFTGGTVIAATAYTGPVFGAVQSLAPPHLRTTAAAITMLLGGVIGQAAGPSVAGAVSDLLQPSTGPASLRWALVAVAPVSLIAAALFWAAASSIKDDLRAAA